MTETGIFIVYILSAKNIDKVILKNKNRRKINWDEVEYKFLKKTKTRMQKILRLDLSRTRKSDFKTSYESVIETAEKYNPEELHISETLNKMKEALPQVDNLKVPALKSPLTETLKENCGLRNKYISSILMQLKAQLKTDEEVSISAVKKVLPLAQRILNNFSRQSFTTQHALAKQFIEEIEENTELKQAVSTLGMDATFNKLKAVQQKVNVTDSNRRSMKTVRKKMNTKKNKNDLYRLMCHFFTAVEGAALEYPSLNYEPLIVELNDVVLRQRAKSTLRTTIAAKLNTSSSAEDIKVS